VIGRLDQTLAARKPNLRWTQGADAARIVNPKRD